MCKILNESRSDNPVYIKDIDYKLNLSLTVLTATPTRIWRFKQTFNNFQTGWLDLL